MNAPHSHTSRARGVALHRFAVGGALAVALVAVGFGTQAIAGSQEPAAMVEAALAKGKVDKGIAEGEAAAAANLQDGAVRTALGRAYLKAGRFESAASVLADAVALGETGARTVLSLALAEIATGHERTAAMRLDQARDNIPAADLGLAMALAGETGRGVAILSDALRGGDKTMKIRENLAYAYALDGRWSEARMMVGLDLPADKVDGRLTQWAQSGQADAARERIATLLGVPVRVDAGMPVALALRAAPAPVQMAVNDAQPAPAPAATATTTTAVAVASAPEPAAELPALAVAPVADPIPAHQPAPARVSTMAAAFEAMPMADTAAAKAPTSTPSFHAISPVGHAGRLFAAQPTRKIPVASASYPANVGKSGGHVVQLGAFLDGANAERAKRVYAARHQALAGHDIVITKALVNGRTFWRVAAVGFDAAAASNTCGSLKQRGGACFAYAANAAPTGHALAGQALAMAKPQQAKASQVKLALNRQH